MMPETIQYKMVFCDIDGTLLDSAHQISIRTVQKVQALYRAGIPFILVSARMPSGIYPLEETLGIKGPIVCYNGALILNGQGSPLKTVGIDREKALRIDGFIKKEWGHICCSVYSYDDWLTEDCHNQWILQEQKITSSLPIQSKISELIPEEGLIHKILCMGEAASITGLNKALKANFTGLSIYQSKATYLEIMDATVSKSDAVKYLCKDYAIPIEATVSFGDHFNDVDMLLATGTCFAMGNAPEEVKRQAQNVTLDNDHEGLVLGLEKLNFAVICDNQ